MVVSDSESDEEEVKSKTKKSTKEEEKDKFSKLSGPPKKGNQSNTNKSELTATAS